MARMAVQEKATAVAAPMKYNRDNSAEVTELEELQKERDAIVEEQEEAEATEALAPEEKTFKKRYGDLRRHAQQKEQDILNQIRQLEEQLS